MKELILIHKKPKFTKSKNYFDSLSKSIIFQQLSIKAGSAIYNRYLNLFENRIPNSLQIINTDNFILREIGLSKQKVEYIKELSNYFYKSYNVDFKFLTNQQIFDELVAIKGIGKWTIDMFLMFAIFRVDILPVSDLGIKKAFKKLYKLNELPTPQQMSKISKPWEPYRTIACYYLWQFLDNGDQW